MLATGVGGCGMLKGRGGSEAGGEGGGGGGETESGLT